MSTSEAKTGESRASDRILNAALALFKARGYHGTPVRELARSVRMEVASLYYHFPSKQEILFALFERIMDALLDGVNSAMAGAASPEERLRAAVRFHVLSHTARQDEAFISHSELRSLSAQNRRRIIAKRDRYERMIRAVLTDGVRAGKFEIDDARLTCTAILVMCSGAADWFAGQGRLSADRVADRFADLAMRLVTPARVHPAPLPPVRKPTRRPTRV